MPIVTPNTVLETNASPSSKAAFHHVGMRGKEEVGGGGGNRTPVPRRITAGFYVRSRPFRSRRSGLRAAGSPHGRPGEISPELPGRSLRLSRLRRPVRDLRRTSGAAEGRALRPPRARFLRFAPAEFRSMPAGDPSFPESDLG